MRGFLDYSPGDSFLHRLNPLTKLLLSLFLCVACFCSGSAAFCLAIIAVNLLFAASAGIMPRALAMLRVLIKFCVFLFVIQVLFIRDGRPLLSLPAGIVITDAGVKFSLLLALRLIGSTLPLAMMLSVTKMIDLSNVLVGKLRIPYKYAFALTTAIRFIPVFADEMSGIMEAQTARGVEFDTGGVCKKVRLILPLCVPLLITSVKKIESAAISAELRGFNNRSKDSGYKQYPFSVADGAAAVMGGALLFISILA